MSRIAYKASKFKYWVIDTITRFVVFIDGPHHEIHEGNSYTVTDYDASVDNAGPKYWRITTPNTSKWSHFQVEAHASDAGLLEIFRTPTEDEPVVPGTALTAYNDNENSDNSATTVIKYDPVFTADGTRIWHSRLGASGIPAVSSGGSASSRREKILKQNTTYTVKFTPDGDGKSVWVSFYWYEHTNEPDVP